MMMFVRAGQRRRSESVTVGLLLDDPTKFTDSRPRRVTVTDSAATVTARPGRGGVLMGPGRAGRGGTSTEPAGGTVTVTQATTGYHDER